MAGIGFELRRILREGTFFSTCRAYAYAALIASGPWLVSVMSLGAVGLIWGDSVDRQRYEIFRTTIIYTYALSLILIGLVQLLTARYLADRYFLGQVRFTRAAYLTVSTLICAVGWPCVLAMYAFFDLSAAYILVASVFFLLVCLTWMAMVFLSSIKDYNQIVLAFAAGGCLGIFGAVKLGAVFPELGSLAGFTLGQALTFFWLLARLLSEFPSGGAWDREMFAWFKKYWELGLIGFLFNSAIWVDKFIFWYSRDSRVVVPHFRTNDIYDAPNFFAYLSILPTLTLFLMRIETRFYEHYSDYYAKIIAKGTYRDIMAEKHGMIRALRACVREVMVFQGLVTGVCIFFAPAILEWLQLFPLQIPLFRICLLGAFMQALVNVIITLLFYFDLRRRILWTSVIYLATNGLVSWWCSLQDFRFYGYGYLAAGVAALAVAQWMLQKSVNELEYLTFARQPVG